MTLHKHHYTKTRQIPFSSDSMQTYRPTRGGNRGASLLRLSAVAIAPVVAPAYDQPSVLTGMGLSPLLFV